MDAAHALLKATTSGCAIVALCNVSAMRTSLILCPSSSTHCEHQALMHLFVYAQVAEQGCCADSPQQAPTTRILC